MKAFRQLFLGVFLCVLVVSPFQVQAQTIVSEKEYRALLIELIQTLQLQIAVLQAELELQEKSSSRTETEASSFGEEVTTGAIYNIRRVSEVGRISNREHREYFARVFELFPNEYDSKIRRLEIFDQDEAEFDAYVETLPPQHEFWLYAVNAEIVKDEDSDSNTELIVHEFAHIISYEGVLGIPKPAESNCEDYFDVHGCPEANSYLRQFVNRFWSQSDLGRAGRFADEKDPFAAAATYYERHEDEYVTDYAAISPEEDFADSFMFYVLEDDSEKGTLAREKVDFFKQYSKLSNLRAEIIENQ